MNVDWNYNRLIGAALLPNIPQIGWCLRPDASLHRLSALLAPGTLLADCRILDVSAKPDRWVDVTYVSTDDHSRTLVATIRFVPSGQGARHFKKAVAGARCADAVRHCAEHDAIVWRFPHDEKLAHLEWFSTSFSPPAKRDTPSDKHCRRTVLSYRRGDRCAIKLEYANGEAAIVGKLNAEARATHDVMVALHGHRDRSFDMPAPLGCDDARSIRWEEFTEGGRFEGLGRGSERKDGLQKLAHSLCRLHRIDLASLPVRSVDRILDHIDRIALKRIDAVDGQLGALCQSVATRLADSLPNAPPHLATLHGDLHTGNVLFRKSGAVFIDLDRVSCGDPAYDLGMFASRLVLLSLVDARQDHELIEWACALPQLYAAAGGAPTSNANFCWYFAALLLGRQVKTCVNHLAPDLHNIVARLAMAAGHLVQAGQADPARLAKICLDSRRAPAPGSPLC